MYKILECELPITENGEALIEVHNTFRVGNARNWKGGRKHKSEIPQPILIEYDTFRGYQGLPMELLDQGIPIMSAKLADAILEAGVNNIDFYDVVLKNTKTSEEYQYKAYNIVGKIAVADLGASDSISYDDNDVANVGFKNLIIDESKAADQLIFRLAENINAIMIHEKVIESIKKNGIDTVDFINPEDWVQL